ncbi:MAG: D-glycerate dehydrogenase [bacterium]|nr:D-glycerate dehydrogenase [bacterium]
MSDKPIVAVTRKIPEAGLKLFPESFDVRVSPHDRPLTAQELNAFVKGASAILSQLTDKIDSKVLEAVGKQLKIVANYAVGFDNIDLAAAKKRKVIITNTPNVLTEAVAEHAFALMMAASRRIVESDKFLRSGKYKGWAPGLLLGQQLEGKTLGILGLGRIGSRVAEIGSLGYKMKVIYFDRGQRNRELDAKIGSEPASMRRVLTASDFISIHVPLSAQTKHMIGKQELSSMKKTTVLINTARGPIIDERALAQALKNKTIFAAGLDVFEFEPEVIPTLKKLDNVTITPHTASATIEARDGMAATAAGNIIAVLSGKVPLNPVQ